MLNSENHSNETKDRGYALILKGFMKLFLLASLVVVQHTSYAQQDFEQEEVSAILAEIESKNGTRAIFTSDSKEKIADIPFTTGFKVVRRSGPWSIVRFNSPLVPGWVSEEYVRIESGRATVKPALLNLRREPRIAINVMIGVNAGYQSQILGRKNGFVRIYAPSNLEVAIRTDGSNLPAALVESKPELTSNDVVAQTSASPSETIDSVAFNNPTDLNAQPQKDVSIAGSAQSTTSNEGLVSTAERESELQHILSPGDSVSLKVFGESDLSIENVRIPQSGRVSFPLIGSMSIAGKTTSQVESDVAALLSQGYVRNPRLSVSIFSYRPIFIRGAVISTGSFPFSEGLTIGTAIALAGGTKNSAKRNGVNVLREGKIVHQNLSSESQMIIESGDVVTVSEEQGVSVDEATFVYLHGEVASPGEYKFRRGLTVEKAIVLAGGFTLRASRGKIKVTRYDGVEENQEPERLKRVKLYTPVKPGDIIDVGASWF